MPCNPTFQYKPLEDMLQASPDNFDADAARKIMKKLADVMHSDDGLNNMKAAQAFIEGTWQKKTLAVAQEWHIHGLLSGVGTQVVNLVGAFNMTLFRPFERFVSAGIEGVQSRIVGDEKMLKQAHQIMHEEMRTVKYLFANFFRGYSMMKQSGGDYKTLSALGEAHPSAIRTLTQGTRGEWLGDWAASIVNLPGAGLQKMDEFMKTWNGLSRTQALLEDKLVREGVHAAERPAMIEERLRDILAAKGNLRHEMSARKALQKAGGEDVPDDMLLPRTKELMKYDDAQLSHMIDTAESAKLVGQEVTFTTDLADGVFGAAAQAVHSFSSRNPATSFMIPFVNTPINIADAVWDRSIGGVLGGFAATMNTLGKAVGLPMANTEKSFFRLQRMLASTDPRVSQQAKMNMIWGFGTAMGIAALASREHDDPRLPILTGSGPTNPDVRKTLEAAGWQPFSVKVGDKYMSYSRLDPFAGIIGIIADASEYLMEHHDEEGENLYKISMLAVVSSIANNITSKTYAQGLANVLDLAMDPDRSGEKVLGAVAGSFVPTILANTEKVMDPDLQEVRSWTDRMMTRIPGLSAKLSPRRDLLGQVMTQPATKREFFLPIRITQVKDSIVESELSRFAYGFSQPTTTKSGIDLLDDAYRINGKQEAYDRYLELSGSHKVNGKDLRQALRKLVQSKEYLKLTPEVGPNGEKSPRIDLINSVIRKHRAVAWKELLKESPALRSDIKQAEKVRSDRRRGRGGLTL